MDDDYLTPDGASNYFGISLNKLWKLNAVRPIPHHRVGKHIRFTREDLDKGRRGQ